MKVRLDKLRINTAPWCIPPRKEDLVPVVVSINETAGEFEKSREIARSYGRHMRKAIDASKLLRRKN